jgi:hypothetical protein
LKYKSKKKSIKRQLKKSKKLIMFYEDYISEVNKVKEKSDPGILQIKIDILEQDIRQMKIDLGYYSNSLEKYESKKDVNRGLTAWRKSHIIMDGLAASSVQ